MRAETYTVRSAMNLTLLIVAPLAFAGCEESPKTTVSPAYAGNRFVGNINGIQATAVVSLEQLPSFTLMSGQINSGVALYTFIAELYGTRGYGDKVENYTGESQRVHIELTPDGFILTTDLDFNPARYRFYRQASG